MLLVHRNCTFFAEDATSAFSTCRNYLGRRMADSAALVSCRNAGFIKNQAEAFLDFVPCLSLLCGRFGFALLCWF